MNTNPIHCNTEGWIGNPLNPIGSLFDTLAEASLTPDSKPLDSYYGALANDVPVTTTNTFAATGNNAGTAEDPLMANTTTTNAIREKPRYQHLPVWGTRDRQETCLTLAMEAALIGLAQQRLMPPGFYAQEKSCKQEDKMITKLQDIELDSLLVSVLRKQTMMFLEGGPFSGLGCGIHPESVPMHTFAKYLFNSLLNYDPDLAYNVGLRAMR